MMNIGAVAEQTGLSRETLRFYEKRGIVQPSGRTPSGYRTFDADAVPTLRFVRNLKKLGFTLAEIQEFLKLKGSKKESSDRIRKLVQKKLREVNEKAAAIAVLQKTLARLTDLCDGRKTIEHCPIIAAVNMMEEYDGKS